MKEQDTVESEDNKIHDRMKPRRRKESERTIRKEFLKSNSLMNKHSVI